jgi:hypothetical protein
MADPKIIKVKSNLDDTSKVALWERHPAHPKSDQFPGGGEIFIADDQEHQVAETPAVLLAIKDDKLVRIEGGSQVATPKENKPAGK